MPDGPLVRVFCHPVDIVDGMTSTIEDIATLVPEGCHGPAGLALAAAYHSSRDYLPRNSRRVHHSPAGTAFPAVASAYPPSLQPLPPMPVCQGRDLLAEAVSAGRTSGVDIDAWVVYLHHDEAVPTESEGRVLNAFGDVYPLALCPASPVTIAYAVALTRDVASRRPGSIIAEALHPQAFVHGFHHERLFGAQGGLRRFLLGLCFCAPCTDAGAHDGIDVTALRSWVRAVVNGHDGNGPLPTLADLTGTARTHDADLAGFLRIRALRTTEIVSLCAREAREVGVGFAWLDATHAWAEPEAVADPSQHPGWQIGVDLAAVAEVCEVVTAVYADTEQRSLEEVDQAAEVLGRRPDGGIVRLLGSSDQEHRNAVDRIADLVVRDVGWVGLYHYGLSSMPLAEVLRRGTRRLSEEGGGS